MTVVLLYMQSIVCFANVQSVMLLRFRSVSSIHVGLYVHAGVMATCSNEDAISIPRLEDHYISEKTGFMMEEPLVCICTAQERYVGVYILYILYCICNLDLSVAIPENYYRKRLGLENVESLPFWPSVKNVTDLNVQTEWTEVRTCS